jgi:hypothetical protein
MKICIIFFRSTATDSRQTDYYYKESSINCKQRKITLTPTDSMAEKNMFFCNVAYNETKQYVISSVK